MPRTLPLFLVLSLLALALLTGCARPAAQDPWAENPAALAAAQDPVIRAAAFLREGPGQDPEAALRSLDALDATRPPMPDAGRSLLLRSVALRLLGRFEDAVSAVNRLILLEPRLPEAFVERGLSMAALDHQERAAEDFDAALVMDPKNARAHMAKGDLFFSLESPAEAEASYSRAIEADPAEPTAWINRGVARDEQGRFASAIEDYTKALALDPRSTAAFANRGVSRSQTGDLAGMCRDYRSACALGDCLRLGEARSLGYCPDAQ